VLLLVVTLLGILFVTGMTLLATMSFESDMIATEKAALRYEAGVEVVGTDVAELLRGGLVSIPGVPFTDAPVAKAHEIPGAGGAVSYVFDANIAAYALMPDVHPLVAQVEPFWVDVGGGEYQLVYGAYTDLEAMHLGSTLVWAREQVPWQKRAINTADAAGENDWALVDADGDGVGDARQMDLRLMGLPPTQIEALSKEINGSARANEPVYLGLRVIPHGAMVNVSESHPLLVETLLGGTPEEAGYRHTPPYSPLLEERVLRRRGGLPPRVFPPTALHGNPEDDDPEGPQGDMTAKLLLDPTNETIRTGEHRYWPYLPREDDDAQDFQIWQERADPWNTDSDTTPEKYNLRPLVTTISYDNLLRRPTRALTQAQDSSTGRVSTTETPGDLVALMREANAAQVTCSGTTPELLPFEYANYPQTIPNGGAPCICATEATCEFNLRKGRLLLSLPWLDHALVEVDGFTAQQQMRLIQDAFLMLLSEAHGPLWDDDEAACAVNGDCLPGEVCDPAGYCVDPTLIVGTDSNNSPVHASHRLAQVCRTAAALTANLLDFADEDNAPTRVAVRSYDFADPAKAGSEFKTPADEPLYVYGLERQPYFSEIAVGYRDNGHGSGIPGAPVPGDAVAWAVELVNPYAITLDMSEPNANPPVQHYYLVVYRDGQVHQEVALPEYIPARGLGVFVCDPSNVFTLSAPGEYLHVVHLDQPPYSMQLSFAAGDVVYLVRAVTYRAGATQTSAAIVVDQFKVPDAMPAQVGDLKDETYEIPQSPQTPTEGYVTSERVVAEYGADWKAPVPYAQVETNDYGHTLGGWNGFSSPDVRPVEVNFADVEGGIDDSGPLQRAFPTTGSLLLLMRHANRSLDDYDSANNRTELAFTANLVGSRDYQIQTGVDAAGNPVWEAAPTAQFHEQIDNGRLPVFDPGGLHHHSPRDWRYTKPDTPGDVDTLPWGQLVFDYFTALPLASAGPYPNDPDGHGDVKAPPRVDLDGLRVHGRINLNAAPWRVLAGLPLLPTEMFPWTFASKLKSYAVANANVDDSAAVSIGEPLATAIVAYREARQMLYDSAGTAVPAGDFGADATGRGWDVANPQFRRGTGFLSVGEIANVRHVAADVASNPLVPDYTDFSFYRADVGMVDADAGRQDFVAAVAVLVMMGDWATVRSDVYTVYGTLRGHVREDATEGEKTDINRRAVRFQETLDRLPTLLGQPTPMRIGTRTVCRTIDTRDD